MHHLTGLGRGVPPFALHVRSRDIDWCLAVIGLSLCAGDRPERTARRRVIIATEEAHRHRLECSRVPLRRPCSFDVRKRAAVTIGEIYSRTEPASGSILDAYLALEPDHRRKLLYFARDDRIRIAGLGSLAALADPRSRPYTAVGSVERAPLLFAAGAFDPADGRTPNVLFQALRRDVYLLPEITLIEESGDSFVQINSTQPPDDDAIAAVLAAFSGNGERRDRSGKSIGVTFTPPFREGWLADVDTALDRIRCGEIDKVVLARESRVGTSAGFSSREMVLNLLEHEERGTLFLYEEDGTFFIGSTPELLVRKDGPTVSTMCLAGTISVGGSETEAEANREILLHDEKNLREHGFVVNHLREAFAPVCSDVEMPDSPTVLTLRHVQHLFTPVAGRVSNGVSVVDVRDALHPTPALAGYPVRSSIAAIRQIEDFNRGLYGGPIGYVDLRGDGEFSVAIRSGVFCRDFGYVYAGCGIVEGSDPSAEYDELDAKLKTILDAFQEADDE